MIRNKSSRTEIAAIALVVVIIGCGSGDDEPAADAASPDATVSIDASAPDAAVNSDVCYPTGIYGKCAETGCPMCLSGANIYSVCSSACVDDAECGDAAELNGAVPLCAPLNPNAQEKICVLTCTSQEQCPCGLECRASGVAGVSICAETL